ncbi:MAG: DUF5063 domain-containing protein [Parasphingorhabdus sp.]|uniref:DUF5063 domain-containing protein n=1 Tax=Parasphingorhabdus sp. TaxID=2709688 RepID=UPI003297F763
MSEVHPQWHDIEASINGFLSLLSGTSKDSDGRLAKLAMALDSLVWAYNHSSDVEPDTDDVDNPQSDYDLLAKRASEVFPELGYYCDVDPDESIEQKIGVGDAIDDIADIARDLSEVLWLKQNVSENEAVWMFRFGYESHWGRHLHDLRRYLHVVMN